MYIPSHFQQQDRATLHELIREHPLGTLVTLGSEGLNANHVPFELDVAAGPHGILRAHVARSNPVWKELSGATEPLVIFQGKSAYISPNFYPSKQVDGRAVPTWNYMAVHVHGKARVIDDPAWMRGFLAGLTSRHEAGAGMAQPWRIDDAPEDYIDKLLRVIVGIEIDITRIEGKWKVSQNQSAENRAGVVQGLHDRGGEDANRMAEAVRRHAPS
jgi:transcriptional regulator